MLKKLRVQEIVKLSLKIIKIVYVQVKLKKLDTKDLKEEKRVIIMLMNGRKSYEWT